MRHEVVDIAPVAECARRLADKIACNPAVAAHYQKRAHQQLLADPRNFRSAAPEDLEAAPAWAKDKAESGAPLHVFAPSRASLARLRRVARQLQETCAEAIYLDALPRAQLSSRDAEILDMAQEFIAKIQRPDFAALEAKSKYFALERKARMDFARAHDPICEKEHVYAGPSRRWHRIRSVAEMWAVGEEFNNCMARTSSQAPGFARDLRNGAAHFFVLRNRAKRGLMVAVGYPARAQIDDIRGPDNAHVASDDPNLTMLCAARGWRAPPPRPSAEALAARQRLIERMARDLFRNRTNAA
ncbi:hypothetical protein U91I_03935 [alpha proteobacterium U9-1i]|nr:hypothetical protein U91I_03935 [alpha proteobacterium U9-1i]